MDAFVQSRFNIEKNYNKLEFKNAFICRVFNFMNAISYACPAHICRALPPSNGYPGSGNKKLKEKTVEVYKNRGIEQYPFHKDAIYNDVNLALGYMHSGYPIMTHDDLIF